MLTAVPRRLSTSTNHQLTTTQSLANKIVRLTLEHQLHPLNRKRTEGLACNAIQIESHIRRKITLRSPQSKLSRQPRTNRAITIRNLRLNHERQPSLNRRHRRHHPRLIERWHRNRLIVPYPHPTPRHLRNLRQHRLKIQIAVKLDLLQQIGPPHRRLNRWQPIARQQMLQIPRKLLEEPDNILRLPAELRPQLRLLRRNPRRTGVQM